MPVAKYGTADIRRLLGCLSSTHWQVKTGGIVRHDGEYVCIRPGEIWVDGTFDMESLKRQGIVFEEVETE